MRASACVMSITMLQPEADPIAVGVDPAFQELLTDPRNMLRRLPASIPIEIFRQAANGFLARASRPDVARVENLAAPGPGGPVPIRLYRPEVEGPLPLVVFFHGGGFLFGGLETHDAMCRALANHAGMAVAAVDYRLAPEHPFPAALEDGIAALVWLSQKADELGLDPERLGLAGDSAGGHLAVGVVLSQPDLCAVRHVGLLYPLVHPGPKGGSYLTYASGYMLTASFLDWCWEAYGRSECWGALGFDLNEADLAGFPSTTVVTAEFDPLRDEGMALALRLECGGTRVRAYNYPGMIHGFAGLPDLTPVADEAIAFVADGFRQAMGRAG